MNEIFLKVFWNPFFLLLMQFTDAGFRCSRPIGFVMIHSFFKKKNSRGAIFMQKSTPAATEGLLGKLTIIGIVPPTTRKWEDLWRYCHWSDVNSANSLCLTTSKHIWICSYNTIIITQSIYIYIFPTHHFNQQWFLHRPVPSQASLPLPDLISLSSSV